MKIIDLFNKIANGEDVPEKFKFAGQIFRKHGRYIEDEDGDSIFDSMCTDFSNINSEVEILEEDKIIEKIPYQFNLDYIDSKIDEYTKEEINKTINYIYDKINEIIDKMENNNG